MADGAERGSKLGANLIADSGLQKTPLQLSDDNSFVGAGGDRIFFRQPGQVEEADAPQALILAFHGIQSHCNSDGYEALGTEAAKRGIRVYARDQRGSLYLPFPKRGREQCVPILDSAMVGVLRW